MLIPATHWSGYSQGTFFQARRGKEETSCEDSSERQTRGGGLDLEGAVPELILRTFRAMLNVCISDAKSMCLQCEYTCNLSWSTFQKHIDSKNVHQLCR